MKSPLFSPSTIEATISTPEVDLLGLLTIPADPIGVVVFAHGSGSGRTSPRNRAVAAVLNDTRIATLLFDLLTPEEDKRHENRFDIELLTWRLVRGVEWLQDNPLMPELPIGLFGASTGAAAALKASTLLGSSVSAVVSRGGRPDLAGDSLSQVKAPTLLIVGGNDKEVESLNRAAKERMRCECQVSIVPGASHLFEEGRSLDTVAALAAGWFLRYFHQRQERHPPLGSPMP